MFSRLSLRLKIQLTIVLVSVITVAAFTYEMVSSGRAAALAEIDHSLREAASAYVFVLGPNYHDKFLPREQVDLKQKRAESERLTQLADTLKVAFVYSYVQKDGKLMYGQAGLSPEQLKDGKTDFYFVPNDLPDLAPYIKQVLATNQEVAIEQNSQYGFLRTLLVPMKTTQGATYVAAADAEMAYVQDKVKQAVLRALLTGAAVLAVAIAVAIVLGNLVSRPLIAMRDAMRSLTSGNGDLSIRLNVASSDEIGQAAGYFNTFAGQLQNMMRAVKEQADRLQEGVREITSLTNRLSSNAHEQSATASAAAATTEEITVSIQHIADNSRDANQRVQEANTISSRSANAMTAVSAGVQEVVSSMNNLKQVMEQLNARSDDISGIVLVIKGIADQTNMLALNAAIEAARAGEQGRGFAVVADEVRKLAERTAQATGEIGEMIQAMHNQSSNVSSVIESTGTAVTTGVGQTDEATQQISNARERMEAAAQMIQDIADAVNEQSTATTQMAQSAERISNIAREGDQEAEQARAIVLQLEDMAKQLNEQVGRFRL